MNNTLLVVDDEPSILSAMKRLFMDSKIDVLTAGDAAEALEILRNKNVDVIVSDQRMPNMTGIELLERVKREYPDSIRILLTGYSDINVAIDAINKGEVYRFITKPWNDRELRATVKLAIEKHQLALSIRSADEDKLLSLAQAVELKDPYTRGHCERVANYSLSIARYLGLDAEMMRNIKHGSWLHDCGKIGVPESILNCKGKLDCDQFEIVKKHPEWGANVARIAKLPDTVINIILYHHEKWDSSGYPAGLKGQEIPFEARIVAIADVYDALMSDRPYRGGLTRECALDLISSIDKSNYDPEIVDAFLAVLEKGELDERE